MTLINLLRALSLPQVCEVALMIMLTLLGLVALAESIVERLCDNVPRWVSMWRRMIDECREVGK
jgi:uncharacterized protein involved in cysteine biosynthesis